MQHEYEKELRALAAALDTINRAIVLVGGIAMAFHIPAKLLGVY